MTHGRSGEVCHHDRFGILHSMRVHPRTKAQACVIIIHYGTTTSTMKHARLIVAASRWHHLFLGSRNGSLARELWQLRYPRRQKVCFGSRSDDEWLDGACLLEIPRDTHCTLSCLRGLAWALGMQQSFSDSLEFCNGAMGRYTDVMYTSQLPHELVSS